ncbi:LuxR C-terminal-related transcriptional regulator [uncultured Erythrobacter sp.]|uniref:helix-turn-helix transcriptional regulator n=1 Tax=uncultured Erythrobacter sp. TaxID=263913 RepID=UPI00265B119C|nr:LuxR C-terminal-related transcriptional regulator [uncultured Erythrobacter sp.]
MPLLLNEWLSAGRNPRLICDAQQRVLWQCPNLSHWLDGASAIKLEREQLVLTDKRAQSGLSEFLHFSDKPDTAISFNDEKLSRRVVLQCRRLEVPRFTPAFGVRIIADAAGLECNFLHFEETFGMTRQESAICRMLLQGRTVQEIVDAGSKSPDTIRFHIRNIYQKIGVSSREALFASLRPFLFD